MAFFAALGFLGGFAHGQTAAQPQTRTFSQLGVPRHELRVSNATPWYCRLATVNKSAKSYVDLAPGETASTAAKGADKHGWLKGAIPFTHDSFNWYARSSNLDVTLAALLFEDALYTQYLGAAVSIVEVPGAGVSSSSSVVIRAENVWFADDVNQNEFPSRQSLTRSPAEKPLAVNYTAGDALGVQMVVWNSGKPAKVMLNRRPQGTIHKGEIYFVGGHSRERITLTSEGSNGETHVWEQTFANDHVTGVAARVFVLGQRDLH